MVQGSLYLVGSAMPENSTLLLSKYFKMYLLCPTKYISVYCKGPYPSIKRNSRSFIHSGWICSLISWHIPILVLDWHFTHLRERLRLGRFNVCFCLFYIMDPTFKKYKVLHFYFIPIQLVWRMSHNTQLRRL